MTAWTPLDGDSPPARGRCARRAAPSPRAAAALAAFALAAFALLFTGAGHALRKRACDVYTAAAYRLDPELRGRSEVADPAPACAPRTSGGGRAAVVTYIRDDRHLELLRQLECTLRRSNPGLELAAMAVEGELAPGTLAAMRALNVTLLPVAPLDVPNVYEPRFARNWLKLRAWELAAYDSVLLVDSDIAFAGDVGGLFPAPAPFAAAYDQPGRLNLAKTAGRPMFQGGALLLRPCAAAAAHMRALVAARPKLRFAFSNAEQEFLSWYFRHFAWVLPLEYNAMTRPSLAGDVTVGGAAPRVVHFTSNKPFGGPRRGSPGHQFLCPLEELDARLGALAPPRAPARPLWRSSA
jgi:hypothetical protein